MARTDQRQITASITVKGVVYPLGTFSTLTGGKADTSENKRSGGAGLGKRARGGKPTTDNVTISREDNGTIVPGQPDKTLQWLKDQRNCIFDIHDTPLDDDRNPLSAQALHYTGTLKGVSRTDADTESEDGFSMLELEQSTDA